MRYVAYIHKDENSCFGISFPDFPSCISVGDTADEAILNGGLALSLHVAGMREDGEIIPAPKSLDTILADKDEATALTDAIIAYVSLVEDSGSPKRVNISLDPGLLSAIDDEAKRRKVTRSAFLASAARHEIQG